MKPDALPADATAHIKTLQHWAESALKPSLASGFRQDKKAAISALHVLGMLSTITGHYSDDNLRELISESMDAEGARIQRHKDANSGKGGKKQPWHVGPLQNIINNMSGGWREIFDNLPNESSADIEKIERISDKQLRISPTNSKHKPRKLAYDTISGGIYCKPSGK